MSFIDHLANLGQEETFSIPKNIGPLTTSFVITYNQTLSLIIHKPSYVLNSSDSCRNVFKNLPLVASNNISSILVRAQIYCQKLVIAVTPGLLQVVFGAIEVTTPPVYTLIEHGRNQNESFYFTGETHKIKSHLTCDTCIVIYMIQCRLCNLQYIGKTKRRLKHGYNDRYNESHILNSTTE